MTLQEELKKTTAALSDSQKRLEGSEQQRAALKLDVDRLSQEGARQQAELQRKHQSLAADLLKVQQEKDGHRKELLSAQESLAQANKALRDSQSQLDSERKRHKSAMEEKVSLTSKPHTATRSQLLSGYSVGVNACLLPCAAAPHWGALES